MPAKTHDTYSFYRVRSGVAGKGARGVAANCPWVGKKFGLGGGSHAEKREVFPECFLHSHIIRLTKITANIVEFNENKYSLWCRQAENF